MSQEDVEIVRRVYEAWNRDRVASTRLVCFSGLRASTAGMRAFASGGTPQRNPGRSSRPTSTARLDEGDTVVTVVRFEAVGGESGAKVELPFTNVWELKGGLVESSAPTTRSKRPSKPRAGASRRCRRRPHDGCGPSHRPMK